jgi:hypothetical protein
MPATLRREKRAAAFILAVVRRVRTSESLKDTDGGDVRVRSTNHEALLYTQDSRDLGEFTFIAPCTPLGDLL